MIEFKTHEIFILEFLILIQTRGTSVNMIKNINVYTLIKVLFILIALSLIVIVRADYHQSDTLRDRIDELMSYFTPLTFDYIVIRLLSFGVLFAACFDLKAAMEKRLHINKKLFIVSMILLLVSLIDYYKFVYNDFFYQDWFEPGTMVRLGLYFLSTRYLTLVVSALAGYLCGSSFKAE